MLPQVLDEDRHRIAIAAFIRDTVHFKGLFGPRTIASIR